MGLGEDTVVPTMSQHVFFGSPKWMLILGLFSYIFICCLKTCFKILIFKDYKFSRYVGTEEADQGNHQEPLGDRQHPSTRHEGEIADMMGLL